jgi:hypothetical protein
MYTNRSVSIRVLSVIHTVFISLKRVSYGIHTDESN